TIALLPYFEETFNILTKLKLIELGDLSHPLLRKMALEAPGTFNHSMLVATLSEQAAECIGADSTFTRVACYYHDIGKMKRPNFYVENQHSGINPHDNLSPTLSTMIIKAHTKDGQEMGKKYKIPKEISTITVIKREVKAKVFKRIPFFLSIGFSCLFLNFITYAFHCDNDI
ncbi:MAG: metal dependent phosphohydrolase, partial [Defluviitaleaceae bacterium]|nr:metal dependent phosphohydrolase [Defluviitaleaceae bacterium]